MPSTSDRQRRFMGAKLAQQRSTGHNDTGMNESQLRDFARKPVRTGARRGGRRAGRA